MGMFDVVNVPHADSDDDREADYFGNKFDRYLQICAPGLVPIIVEVVNNKEDLGEETERGNGGFGSTGR
jgi:dUTPase